MKRLIPVWAALALLLGGIAPTGVRAGTITYDIVNYPAEQNGHSLSGLIITDGKIGMLASSDILSWTFTVDGSTTVSGDGSLVGIAGDVEASATQITLAQPPLPTPPDGSTDNALSLLGGVFFITWSRTTYNDGTQVNGYTTTNASSWIWTTNPGDTLGGTDPWVIAENPEPASLTLLGIGGVALLGYGWRRRRRTAE